MEEGKGEKMGNISNRVNNEKVNNNNESVSKRIANLYCLGPGSRVTMSLPETPAKSL